MDNVCKNENPKDSILSLNKEFFDILGNLANPEKETEAINSIENVLDEWVKSKSIEEAIDNGEAYWYADHGMHFDRTTREILENSIDNDDGSKPTIFLEETGDMYLSRKTDNKEAITLPDPADEILKNYKKEPYLSVNPQNLGNAVYRYHNTNIL